MPLALGPCSRTHTKTRYPAHPRDRSTVCRIHRSRDRKSSVELSAQGAFNQASNIIAANKATGFCEEYVFRVALPIYPHYKLESDVATTEFVRHTTTVPVPIIYAFDSSPNNKLGFEWMLMEKVKKRIARRHMGYDGIQYEAGAH